MPTIRLVPSAYTLSNTTYLSVSNASNMYDNCDSDTYATVTNSRSSTTNYYIYIHGFNFDDVPSIATVSSFTIKLKAMESGVTTSTSYRPALYNNTTSLSGTCNMPSTTVQTLSFTSVNMTWDTLKSYGNNFRIRINCRRANSNTTAYMYIYGAEIEVNYTLPVAATVTTSLTGNGTISPSGATNTYVGEEFTLTITPTNVSDEVTATRNGNDITQYLETHYSGSTLSTNLGTYTLSSGGFNGSGASYFQGIVGNGVNASQTTSNYYSSGSGSTAVFTYAMNFTVPSNATISRVWCEVNGHAESTTQTNEYMCVQLKSGSTDLSEEINFKNIGTTNETITLECETVPTASQLASMVLECTVGYYGGAINGATAYVEYYIAPATIEYYTYTYTVSGDAAIVVTIGSSGSTATMYMKVNGSWVTASKVYKKTNGVWVEQTDLTNVFDPNTNYVKG